MNESKPCPEQDAIMKSFGFRNITPDDLDDRTVWNHPSGVVLTYGNTAAPTAKSIMLAAIADAIEVGEKQRAAAIAKLLK